MNLRPGQIIKITDFAEEKSTFYVYWIYQTGMSNPYTEGYIGITDYVEKRMMQHLYDKSGTQFDMKLREMDLNSIEVKVLHKFTDRKLAQEVENNYRPTKCGWNAKAGG